MILVIKKNSYIKTQHNNLMNYLKKFETHINDDKNSNIQNDIILVIFTITNQTRLFHWQSDTHNQHVIFGDFYELFVDLSDKLIEVISGKYGKVVLSNNNMNLCNYSDVDSLIFVDYAINIFEKIKQTYENDSDILNILDEIVSEFQKLKYLLKLK